MNDIISYFDMCRNEGTSLQKGMNFGIGNNYSVILVSFRKNAPYEDRIEDEGQILIYEGHDVPKTKNVIDPKTVDQQLHTKTGKLTENGKFFNAVQDYKHNKRDPEIVKVYEKIRTGIWSYNGMFLLVDAWQEKVGYRSVVKYKLKAIEGLDLFGNNETSNLKPRRIIPSWVKREVWKRDMGKCQVCGATDELHFDHIIPYSKGGSSNTPDNIQLLCERHNLEKRDKIQ